MGKSVEPSEYRKAKQQMVSCRTSTCPNAGAKQGDEASEYCGACKTARRTVREFERARK